MSASSGGTFQWTSRIGSTAVRAMPPREPETASVPAYLVNRASRDGVPTIRWRGDDDVELTDAIAPGDVVIVPSGTVGLAPTPPTDVAEEAAELARQAAGSRFGARHCAVATKQATRCQTPSPTHISRLGRCDVLPYPGGVVVAQRQATSMRSTQAVTLQDHCEAVATLAADNRLGVWTLSRAGRDGTSGRLVA